jgi:hypothetical protein
LQVDQALFASLELTGAWSFSVSYKYVPKLKTMIARKDKYKGLHLDERNRQGKLAEK